MRKISEKAQLKAFAFIYYAVGGMVIGILVIMLTSPQLYKLSAAIIVLLFIAYFKSDTARFLIRAWTTIATRYTKNYENSLFTQNPSEGEGK